MEKVDSLRNELKSGGIRIAMLMIFLSSEFLDPRALGDKR